MKKCFYLLTLLFISFDSVSQQQAIAKEGYVQVEGGQIWYKVAGSGQGVPLLVVHGGPGSRSCDGMYEYSKLGNDRPIVFYDQLGSGKSDRPTDTALWYLSRFVDEITVLREKLELKEVHLLGNSWGASVVVEYMLTQKPKGVKSVIFSGPLLSTSLWMQDAKHLVAAMPQYLQDTIHKYQGLQQYNAPAYLAATDSFYARYLTRKQWPPVKSSACEGIGGFNEQVYKHMWGPNEFTASGTLKSFDRSGRLHELKLPVLFIVGQYDEVRVETARRFQRAVNGSKVAIIENAGHAKTIDNPDQYLAVIRQFLKP